MKKSIKLSFKNTRLLLIFSGVIFVLVAVMFYIEFETDRPWKGIQRDFVEIDETMTEEALTKADTLPEGLVKEAEITKLNKRADALSSATPTIRQVWLTQFNTADRCMTCHLGIELPRFADAEQPFTTHPGDHIKPNRHGVDAFGCVICHEGQGVGLTVEEAHGQIHHNWMTPLLTGKQSESSCEACHAMGSDIAKDAVMTDAPSFSKGRSLYLQTNCLGCHVADGYKRDAGIGPILTAVATKSDPAWAQTWVKNPKGFLANTVMPDFELSDDKIKAITAYLYSLAKPGKTDRKARAKLDDAQAVARGEKNLSNLGCLGCHSVDGKDEGFGPDLSRVAEKTTPEWLYAWIENPTKYWPETNMPTLRVPGEDIQDLVAYLSSLRKETIADSQPLTDPALIETGKKLTAETGCTGCHNIGDFAIGYNAPPHDGIGQKRVDELVFGETKIDHTLANWLALKVQNPRAFNTEEIPTLMPNFGLSKAESEDVLTFLLSIRNRYNIPEGFVKPLINPVSASAAGAKLIEESNCLGCHKIGDKGGDVGPDLSFQGERINPQWMTNFLMNPTKIRPIGIEPTRMPTFGFKAEEAEALTAYFADLSKVSYPYYQAEKKKLSSEDMDKAWKIYFQTFSCQSCHAWNTIGGVVGPDQSDLAKRLRAEWIQKYLANPQKFIDDVQMPNFEMYPDELEVLTQLIMTFNEIPEPVWNAIKKRWDDELLGKQAAAMGDE